MVEIIAACLADHSSVKRRPAAFRSALFARLSAACRSGNLAFFRIKKGLDAQTVVYAGSRGSEHGEARARWEHLTWKSTRGSSRAAPASGSGASRVRRGPSRCGLHLRNKNSNRPPRLPAPSGRPERQRLPLSDPPPPAPEMLSVSERQGVDVSIENRHQVRQITHPGNLAIARHSVKKLLAV